MGCRKGDKVLIGFGRASPEPRSVRVGTGKPAAVRHDGTAGRQRDGDDRRPHEQGWKSQGKMELYVGAIPSSQKLALYAYDRDMEKK